MEIRTSYDNTPEHLQLDSNKAKCPCGKKAVAFWIESTTGMHIGFECEKGHLFEIDMKYLKERKEVKIIYAKEKGLSCVDCKNENIQVSIDKWGRRYYKCLDCHAEFKGKPTEKQMRKIAEIIKKDNIER